MIKAVIFDVDGVLVDSLNANHKFFTDLMNKFGHRFMKREEFLSFFHLPMKDIIRHSTKSTNEEEIEKIWKSGKDREVPYPNELLNTQNNLEEVIKLLSKDYTLGIVTSRAADSVFNMPQLSDLGKYFKVVIGYTDTKNHKPHPEPLILATTKLNMAPEECVYIGDSETDIIAAKAAGMKSILYSKEKLYGADDNFEDFDKLAEVVNNL